MGNKFIKKAFYYSPFKEIKDSKALYGIKCYIYQHFYEHLDLSLEYKMFDGILTGYSIDELGFKDHTQKEPNMEVAAIKIQKDFQKFRTWLEGKYTPDRILPPNPDQDARESSSGLPKGEREENNTEKALSSNKT